MDVSPEAVIAAQERHIAQLTRQLVLLDAALSELTSQPQKVTDPSQQPTEVGGH